jgi:hypothetical protein
MDPVTRGKMGGGRGFSTFMLSVPITLKNEITAVD